MHRKHAPTPIVILFALFISSFEWLLETLGSVQASAFHMLLTISPTATSLPSSPSQSSGGFDPAIWAAFIGLGGVIVGALITGAFALYQFRRSTQIEKQRQEEQFKHEQEMERFRKEIEMQSKKKEQEEQNEATKAEALRLKMLLAQTNNERGKTYRQSLKADPRVSRMQILDMSHPLEIANIYVRVRVNEEHTSYEFDSTMGEGKAQRDPNVLLQAGFHRLEKRVKTAIDPEAAIRAYKYCIFTGDPGAGKTTLLKYLTLKSAENQLDTLPDLPLRIELNAFASSGHQSLLDFAVTEWENSYGFPKADARIYLEENLENGNVLLLLDALDETVIGETPDAAEASYERVVNVITQIAVRYPQIPIVVTARKAGYHQRAPLVGFTELEVLDFSREDVKQFVENWFCSYQDPQRLADAHDLNAKLERNPRMQALAANPLLLSLIVIVYEAQLDLPERRAELYKRCVETLLTEWDAKRRIRRRREFKPEQKRQLLAEIAWHFHVQGQRYFPEQELLRVIADFLPKVRLLADQNGQILAEIANEQGLLKEQAHGWHGFLHLTLQEYFVAQYVTDHQRVEMLLSHRGDPWWEEVLLLYAGHTPDASMLLAMLIRQTPEAHVQEDIFYTNLLLAGRCLAARPILQQAFLWETIVHRLFHILVTSDNLFLQRLTIETLATIGGQDINTRLLDLLNGKQIDEYVRLEIIRALGSLGDRAVVPELVKLLGDNQLDKKMRVEIATTLRSLGDRSVVPELMQLLGGSQLDREVRVEIATTLGSLGDRSVVPELAKLLSEGQLDREVRVEIATTLGSLGDRSVVPELAKLLGNGQLDREVRVEIATTLGSLGDRSVVPDLVKLLSDDQLDKEVRVEMVRALGRVGDRSVVPELVELLSDDQLDKEVRVEIAWALGSLGDCLVMPALAKLLSDGRLSKEVRVEIAWALGRLGDRSAVPELMQLLRGGSQLDRDVYKGIAWALGRLGDRSVVPELMQLLRGGSQLDKEVHMEIARTLGSLGDRSVVPELAELLGEDQLSREVRVEIAWVLGKVGDRSVVPALAKLLSDDQLDKEVRVEIASTLGSLGDRSAMPALVQLLSDDQLDKEVRIEIASTLRRVGDRSVIPELAMLLNKSQLDREVRIGIASTLGSLGDRSVMPELAMLLNEDQLDKEVRVEIAWALGRLGDRSVVPELMQLLKGSQLDRDVRMEIARTLGSLRDHSIVPELMQLLNERQLSIGIRIEVAKALERLGDRSVVLELAILLDKERLDKEVRIEIANAIKILAHDEAVVHALIPLLETSDIKDTLYSLLWTVSRRVGVRIIRTNDSEEPLKVVKW